MNRDETGSGHRECFVFGTALAAAAAVLLVSLPSLGDFPMAAERSASRLPPPRVVDLSVSGSGAYVPQVSDLAPDSSGVLIGEILWNFGITESFGLFGKHDMMGMWWANVALLGFGHEVGLRYLCTEVLSLEAAYLGHRVDKAWVDDLETHPGGVIDNGVEISTRLAFRPMRKLRIEGRFIGRIFGVYKDTQGVTGLSLLVALMPRDGHSLDIELAVLRTLRSRPRAGVERVTWNTVGAMTWRSDLSPRIGIMVGAKIFTNLMVGEVPMLELKRSMIDEPMALATLGLYFRI